MNGYGSQCVDDPDTVEDDPDDHEDRLEREVAAGTEVPGQLLGEAAERIGIVDRSAGGPAGGFQIVASRHQFPARVTRQSPGRTLSSTSSIVTAPISRPTSSVTASATTS